MVPDYKRQRTNSWCGFGGGYLLRGNQISKVRPNFAGQFQGRGNLPGGNMMPGQGRGGGMVQGEIISLDDKTITVKLADGSSKIIILGDSTSYSEETSISKDVLKVGVKVGIFGTTNSDGSVTAQSVQLNPVLRMLPAQPSN